MYQYNSDRETATMAIDILTIKNPTHDQWYRAMFGRGAVTTEMRDAATAAASGAGTYETSARADLEAIGIPMGRPEDALDAWGDPLDQ